MGDFRGLGVQMEASWGEWGAFGGSGWSSWRVLGPFVRFWGSLGGLLGGPGVIWGGLGSFWVLPWDILRGPEAIWGGLGAPLGTYGEGPGAILDGLGSILHDLSRFRKSLKNHRFLQFFFSGLQLFVCVFLYLLTCCY